MIDINLKYQIAIFGAFEEIVPNPDTLKYLIETFSDKALIPTTFQEIGQNGLVNRLRLKSMDDLFNIVFSSNRIDILKTNQSDDNVEMGSLEKFIKESMDISRKINIKFPKKFNRLAFVTNMFIKELDKDEMYSIYQKTVNSIDLYKLNEPIEWNNRVASRIPVKLNSEELFNVISEINRVKGNRKIRSGIQPFDRIELNFDINTSQTNTDYRFEIDDVNLFLDKAVELERQLESEYVKLLFQS